MVGSVIALRVAAVLLLAFGGALAWTEAGEGRPRRWLIVVGAALMALALFIGRY